MLNEFIKYLDEQVDKGLYVLGAQTQIIKDGIVYKDDTMQKQLGTLKKWMADVGQTASDYTKVNTLYQNRIKRWGNIAFRIMDCSGLGMNFLYNIKHITKGDMTANGMRAKCQNLDKDQLKRGDWVFKVNSKGRATHIGYIVDDSLNVIEDYGKTKGVIKRSLSAGKWNAYGRPEYFKEEIEKEEEPKVVFIRVLKRVKPIMTGNDVKVLQHLLNESDKAGLAEDGKFGPATEKAVKAYQKEKGLAVDGKAGPKTIASLGGAWAK